MSASTGAVGSGRREYSQLPVERQQLPAERAQLPAARPQTNQDLSTKDKIWIGCLTLLGLGVNYTFFKFERCIDTNNFLMGIQDYQTFIDLNREGLVEQTGDGFIPTAKLVQAIKNNDPDITEFLKQRGIDTKDGIGCMSCNYTYGEAVWDAFSGHNVKNCGFHDTEKHSTTCALLEKQELREQQHLLRKQQQTPPSGKNISRVLTSLRQLITGANSSSSTREKKDFRFLDYTDRPINGANHSSPTE